MIATPRQHMTPQDYLEWEERQDIKYEYVNGEVFAISEGTIPHNDIAVNLTTAYLLSIDKDIFFQSLDTAVVGKFATPVIGFGGGGEDFGNYAGILD